VYFGTGSAADALPELWNDASRAQLEQARHAKQTWNYSRTQTAAQFDAIAQKLRAQGEGALADRVTRAASALRTMPDAPTADTARANDATVNDAIVAEMRRTAPSFFDQFAADMKSGNQLRVQIALRAATRAVFDAVAPRPAAPAPKPPATSIVRGQSVDDGSDPDQLPDWGGSLPSPWLWAINVVAAVNAVVVVNVAAAALFLVVSVPAAGGDPTVDQDATVDLLTKRFAAE
jgi:hypothetical protein